MKRFLIKYFLKKSYLTFEVNFNYLFYAYYNQSFFELSIIFCKDQQNGYHFKDKKIHYLNFSLRFSFINCYLLDFLNFALN